MEEPRIWYHSRYINGLCLLSYYIISYSPNIFIYLTFFKQKKFPNPEEELPVLNKTILNTEVTKVDYSSEDSSVKITTLDGKEYIADHVIMTPSLGVLKAQYETLFNPPLPESKIKTIQVRFLCSPI